MYNAEVRSDVVAVRFYHFHAWQQIIWWRSFNSLLKAASKQVLICVLFVLSVSPRAHQGHQTKEKNLMTANGMKLDDAIASNAYKDETVRATSWQ